MCFFQCGLLLATLILLFMGLISRLCCHFLLKSAILARRRNFEFLGNVYFILKPYFCSFLDKAVSKTCQCSQNPIKEINLMRKYFYV